MLPVSPNRKFLNIQLITDPTARDCVEDILASVISWLGRPYEVMFASSWSFDFKPGSSELVGPRLNAEISPALDLLETHHGVRVSFVTKPVGTALFALALEEICGGRPIVLRRSNRSVADPGSTPQFALVLGFDRRRQVLLYRATDVRPEGSQKEGVVHTLPLKGLVNWSGPHATFTTGNVGANLDWRPILREAALRFHDRSGQRLEMMASFAREIGSMDIKAEVHGHQNWYWVPLFYNLRRISQGRIQFASLLRFFEARFDLREISEILSDFQNAGRSWQLVRSLMIKYSLTVDDRALLNRISTRILDVSATEQQIAEKLILLVDRDRSRVRSDTARPAAREEQEMHTVSSVTRHEAGYVAPRSAIEICLVRIWEDVLGMENVGIRDNFFELGGDSLLGMKILAQMHKAGLAFEAGQIYQHQTIEELAAVTAMKAGNHTDREPETGSMPFLPLQYKGISEGGPSYGREGAVRFHIATVHDLTSDQLEKVANRLLVHHDALRLRFPRNFEDQRPAFCESSSDSMCSQWIDLSGSGHVDSSDILDSAPEKAKSVIDLHTGPLFVLLYFKTPTHVENVLCMCVHHIVSDAISNGILEEDILSLVRQAAEHREFRLPRKTTSIKQWSHMLFNYVRSQDTQEADYWKSRSWSRVRPILPDRSDEASVDTERLISVELTAGVRMTRSLFSACRALRITIHELLLASLAKTLAGWSGSNVVLIEHIHHGRDPIFEGTDLSRTVGFFSVEVPLVLELPAASSLETLLEEVSSQIRNLPEKGVGYSLLRYLSKEKDIVRFLEAIPTYQARYNAVIEPHQDDPTPDCGADGSWHLEWYETSTSPARIGATSFTLENKPRMEKGCLVLPLRFGQKGLFYKETVARVVDSYTNCLERFAGLGGGVQPMKPRLRECA